MVGPNHSDGPRKNGRPTEFVTRLTPSQARDILGYLLERHPELLSEAEAWVGRRSRRRRKGRTTLSR